jgi:hypothetical protein
VASKLVGESGTWWRADEQGIAPALVNYWTSQQVRALN